MTKPNILHIFVDQQRFDTICALNNPIIRTPNLDRLYRSGVAFTNAYSPSPVCVAARCSMIYGQYPVNTGCYENESMPLDGRQTFMDALSSAGYRTHGIGKCHFEPDSYALKGFQTRERQEELGAVDYESEPYLADLVRRGYGHVCEPYGIRGEMYYLPQPSQLSSFDHPSQWIGDQSVDFISEQKDSGRPWYLFASFIHPHPPFAPPNPWHKLYRAASMPLPNIPEDSESLLTFVNRCQNRYKYRDQGIDKNLLRCMKAYYYACISFVDYQIGKMLDALQSSGQSNNTLIVFTSDHGEFLGDMNCFGKRSMHDPSSRIPMILSLPGKFAGGLTCDSVVSLVDIAPTILSVSGAEINSHTLDGEDLSDILSCPSRRETVFSELSFRMAAFCSGYLNDNENYKQDANLWRAATSSYMAVSKEWKYFYSAPDQREFLFDRNGDPTESRNKIGVPFFESARVMMKRRLMDHLVASSETAGISGDNWKKLTRMEMPIDPDYGLLVQDSYVPLASTIIPGYSTLL